MSKDGRYRNWVFVLYPESAPDNWLQILKDMHLSGWISPLHSDDKNPDGEPKKEHYHVVLRWQGKKTFAAVEEITKSLNATRPEPCSNIRSYARYLCHLDNPEKAQYDVAEVVTLGDADYLGTISSAADTDTVLADITRWCDDNGVVSFRELSNYARENKPDWWRVLTSSRTVFLKAYLQSAAWERTQDAHSHVQQW